MRMTVTIPLIPPSPSFQYGASRGYLGHGEAKGHKGMVNFAVTMVGSVSPFNQSPMSAYLQSCGIPMNRRSLAIVFLGVSGQRPEVLCELTNVVVVVGALR